MTHRFIMQMIWLMVLCLPPLTAFAATIEIPRTGQSTSYAAGDDGGKQAGKSWPSPRFTDNNNGTVTDNLTGLIWLKNANCFGPQNWTTALNSANILASGTCGLTDGSSAGQWRLPNRKELKSLVNRQQAKNHEWLNAVGFFNVQNDRYWSSSTCAINTGFAWYVLMQEGIEVGYYENSEGISIIDKTYSNSVLPVRGGQ